MLALLLLLLSLACFSEVYERSFYLFQEKPWICRSIYIYIYIHRERERETDRDRVLLYHPAWSAVVGSQLITTSASLAQAILVPPPPEWDHTGYFFIF